MQPETTEDSANYGIWPTLVGLACAAAMVWMMFHLATGFA